MLWQDLSKGWSSANASSSMQTRWQERLHGDGQVKMSYFGVFDNLVDQGLKGDSEVLNAFPWRQFQLWLHALD